MMTTKKRLIDADALKSYLWVLYKYFGSLPCSEADKVTQRTIKRCIGELNKMPTVDAVEVPCKIGDSVWGIKIYNHGREAKKGVVHQMVFGEDMRLCICVKNVCRGEWGKNVFATKEEAEAALAKMDGDGNG